MSFTRRFKIIYSRRRSFAEKLYVSKELYRAPFTISRYVITTLYRFESLLTRNFTTEPTSVIFSVYGGVWTKRRFVRIREIDFFVPNRAAACRELHKYQFFSKVRTFQRPIMYLLIHLYVYGNRTAYIPGIVKTTYCTRREQS